jgi:hypothetical protein
MTCLAELAERTPARSSLVYLRISADFGDRPESGAWAHDEWFKKALDHPVEVIIVVTTSVTIICTMADMIVAAGLIRTLTQTSINSRPSPDCGPQERDLSSPSIVTSISPAIGRNAEPPARRNSGH